MHHQFSILEARREVPHSGNSFKALITFHSLSFAYGTLAHCLLAPIEKNSFLFTAHLIDLDVSRLDMIADQGTCFVPITDRKKLTGAVVAGIGLGILLGWRSRRR
jgi:hypothetical protein